MELHWQSRVLSKSAVLKKFQLSTPNTGGVWAVDISCVHPTLSVVSSYNKDQESPALTFCQYNYDRNALQFSHH